MRARPDDIEEAIEWMADAEQEIKELKGQAVVDAKRIKELEEVERAWANQINKH